MRGNKRPLLLCIGLLGVIAALCASPVRAQVYPPGFDVRIEWEFFEEQSKELQKMDCSQVGARIGYTLPETFDLFVALDWQEMDARLKGDTKDLDPALAFRIGGKLYAVRSIPVGVPADLTLSLSYSTAKHEESQKPDNEYTHRRIIGTGGLEWRYIQATPYLNMGVLYSKLEAPTEDFDQTSLLIAAGVYAGILENVYLRAEINIVQEIGYALGVMYRF